MAMDSAERRDEIEEELQAAEFERLYGTVRMQLRRGQTDSAAQAAAELLERWPESTTAHELMGDVLQVQGKTTQAMAAFTKARELEPANADAERKYAALLLRTGETERRRERMTMALENPAAHVRTKQNRPVVAAALAFVFPGFGQVYNDDYVKGLGLFAGASVLLILLVNDLVINPYTEAIRAQGRRHGLSVDRQIEATRAALSGFGVLHWALIFMCVMALIALSVYGIWDAYKIAQRMQAEQDEIGVG
jgi:tetratricopeptide (TPR) repeat protein